MPWFPRGKYFWDFWFTWDFEQQLHLFYLQAIPAVCDHDPERRHDISTIGHAVYTASGWHELSTDQPAFAASPDSGSWDDLSIWTGSIIAADVGPDGGPGYWLFYTARQHADVKLPTPRGEFQPQKIGLAYSPNLITWQRQGFGSVITNPGLSSLYDGVNWRDPYVVQDQTGEFYAFVSTRLQVGQPSESAKNKGGCVAFVRSPDLTHWPTQPQVLMTSDDFYQLEVPQVFWRHQGDGTKRFYLVFCAQELDCTPLRPEHSKDFVCQTGTYYRFSEPVPSDQAVDYDSIPWQEDSPRLLVRDLYAGKLLWRFSDRQTAFILEPDVQCLFYGFQWADLSNVFVGGLSDPMSVQFHANGLISLDPHPDAAAIAAVLMPKSVLVTG
jgi:beta-fructofuranosidase